MKIIAVLTKLLGLLVGLGWLALGILQIVATMDGIKHWINVGSFIAFVIALVLGAIPLLGTVLGMVGAHYVWEWSWLMSFMLFFGFLIVVSGLSALVKVIKESA